MAAVRRELFGLGLVVLTLGGCSQEPIIKPPVVPHEYVLPPSGDSRFSTYPRYPDKLLNQGATAEDAAKPPPKRFGAPGGRMPVGGDGS